VIPEKKIKMDQIDVLRQEYLNHRAIGAVHKVPSRNEFVHVNARPEYLDLVEGRPCDEANCADYPYDYLLERGSLAKWDQLLAAFMEKRNDEVDGIGGAKVSLAGD
jgi:hypothetical protein